MPACNGTLLRCANAQLWRTVLRASLAFCAASSAFAQGEWKQLPPLPDPLGVAGAFTGVCNDKLLVAGGANFPNGMPWEGGKKVWHNRVWVLDAPDGKWREAGRLPRPLAYGVSVRDDGGALCIGGSDSERHRADAFRLAWKDGALSITPAPSLPVPLANAAGAVTDGTTYVACGATEPGEKSASNRAFALDRNAAAWRELPPLPAEPRILPVAAGVVDDFYIFGGAAIEMKDGKPARRYLRDAWCYNKDGGWRRLPDLPKPCVAAPSPAMERNGQILLIAGDDGSLTGFSPPEKHPGFPAAILAYDVPSGTWSEAGKTPAPRATVPAVWWRGRIIIPSGEVRPGVRSAEVWSLSP